MNITGKTIFQGWTFKLIIVNILIFVIQIFAERFRVQFLTQESGLVQGPSIITYYLGLNPAMVAGKGYIWQIFSYMFLHSTYSFSHIFFNMYALLIFGLPIENEWGSRRFVIYYLFCGTIAGLSIFLINFISQGLGYHIPTIGASGAIFGLLLAFGIMFPNAELLIFFILPIKAKYLVFLYGGLELFLVLTGSNSGISHIGHLGGVVGGLLYFLTINRKSLKFKYKINRAVKEKIINKAGIPDDPRKIVKSNDTMYQINILKKLRNSGIQSLTDEEIQYIKYIEIMAGDRYDNSLCNEKDFNADDPHCLNCEDFKACFLREVKKYL